MQLGEPIREYSLFGKTVWQYNGLADGNGRPTITFDSASGKVLNVQAGLKYLTTEKDAIEILTIIYYQK
jgi:hypothetical protein